MNNDGIGDLGYNWGGGSLVACPSSGIQATVVSANDENSLFGSTMDPHILVSENGEFRGSQMGHLDHTNCYYTSGILDSQGVSSTSKRVQYPSDSMTIESITDLPCASSASFADMVGLYSMPAYCQGISCPAQDVKETEDGLTSEENNNSCKGVQGGKHIPDEETKELSPRGKRQKIVPATTADRISEKKDEMKEKSEQNTTATVHSKTTGREVKPRCQRVETPKDGCASIRAKRGQATSAHSLAERLRRERINERMKFLQDLVPGCNKVTGKAVMLDEIINYVQSLQRQVEFLSMKLGTVYPEMKVDIEKLLSKDIQSSEGPAVAACGSAMSSPYSIIPINMQGPFPAIYNLNLQPSPGGLMPSAWHQEQNCSMPGLALPNQEPTRSHHE